MSCKILNSKTINDNQFLKLMIVHHKAALGMSYSILKTSHNDVLLDFARKIIINQSYEVDYMISHHNTALLLSKLIIKSTNNQQILALAQIISLDQAKEIFILSTLYESTKTDWRNKIKNL